MQFLQRLSVRRKLIAILLLLSIISLTIGFTIVITHDIATFRRELVENGITIARVIGDYSIVDLTFRDPDASKQTLAKLSSIDHVACAFLYDSNGNLFSTYSRADCTSPAPRLVPVEFQSEFLHLSQPIQDGERKYGTIYLRFSLAGLNQKINQYLFTMISLVICMIALSFVLATLLQRLISKPLIQLSGAIQKVTDERDYSIRVTPSDSTDEMGVLFNGFNRMLNQLEKRKEERDVAEHALRESEYRYRVLVESSPVAIFLVQDEKIVYINPAALSLTGYSSPDQLEKIEISSLIKDVDTQTAQSIPQESVFLRKDGSTVDVEISSVETTHQGKPAIQYLIRDVTESKSLRQAAQRMERLAAIGEFSAMLAHEIRNSIGSVALNVRLLSERLPVPEAYRKNLQNMELGIQRIQDLIKAILDFARPASPKFQQVRLHRVIDSSIHLVEEELAQGHITLERQYDRADPEVDVDVNQISQVLLNLFLNAKNAMNGSGEIFVKTSAVRDGVTVEVADTGKGIPPEHLSKIFDPFFTTTPKGIGLGLAFVLRILEQHNAQIFVDSKVHTGTVFRIWLPAVRR